MKKRILIVFLLTALGLLSGCQKIVARRDNSQIVEFDNHLSRGEYILKAYRLHYPEAPEARDRLFDSLNTLMGKMVAHHKDITMIIPFEMYQDIINIGIREVRESEKVFFKPASDLSQEERELIDSKIKIEFPTNAGTIQQYLNKQVYYWLDYLKRGSEYDEYAYYTELDKMRIVDEVFDNRKLTSQTFIPIIDNFIIEADSSNIVKAGKAGLPIYTTEMFGKEKEIEANIIILKAGAQKILIPEKIVLVEGTDVDNIKDYRFGIKIEDVTKPTSLIIKLDDEEDIKIKELKKFKVIKPKEITLKKASVSEGIKPRDVLEIENSQSQWRIN